MRTINKIVLHCSATPGSMDIGAAEIRRWHTDKKPKGNGWSSIGYHHVIRRDGTVEDALPHARAGIHAAGHNAKSIGVCLVGGCEKVKGKLVTRRNFTPEQMAALERLVRELMARYPDAEVLGHRDLNPGKDCPSFSVRDWLREAGIAEREFRAKPKPKPLVKDKSIQAAAFTSTGTAGAALTDAGNQIAIVSDYSDTLRIVFILLIIGGIGLGLYDQLQRRKRAS